jgi:hypothetical protein
LYINDGKGRLAKSNGLPTLYENKSCVAIDDVDKDGDQDIFVGTLSHSKAYGLPQTSHLLLNDGKGTFTVAPENRIALSSMGMVTTAAFEDLNKDGWKELIVAGEWMPVTVFENSQGTFSKRAIPGSSGWWQTIFMDDVNGDGHVDMLAGNWGCNNKFWSGKNGPLGLYVSDFDKNGRVDQLLSYTLNGKEYPFLAKDEVERSLPELRKHYLLYAEYAGETMKDVFYGWVDTLKPFRAERMPSAAFWGDGKGGFTIQDLPAEIQLAPIFAFQKIKSTASENWYIAGGNFYDVIPYEGRYDAQPLAVFSIRKNNLIEYYHQPDLFSVKSQIRDIKWLRTTGNEDIFAVAGNNAGLLFYTLNK